MLQRRVGGGVAGPQVLQLRVACLRVFGPRLRGAGQLATSGVGWPVRRGAPVVASCRRRRRAHSVAGMGLSRTRLGSSAGSIPMAAALCTRLPIDPSGVGDGARGGLLGCGRRCFGARGSAGSATAPGTPRFASFGSTTTSNSGRCRDPRGAAGIRASGVRSRRTTSGSRPSNTIRPPRPRRQAYRYLQEAAGLSDPVPAVEPTSRSPSSCRSAPYAQSAHTPGAADSPSARSLSPVTSPATADRWPPRRQPKNALQYDQSGHTTRFPAIANTRRPIEPQGRLVPLRIARRVGARAALGREAVVHRPVDEVRGRIASEHDKEGRLGQRRARGDHSAAAALDEPAGPGPADSLEGAGRTPPGRGRSSSCTRATPTGSESARSGDRGNLAGCNVRIGDRLRRVSATRTP